MKKNRPEPFIPEQALFAVKKEYPPQRFQMPEDPKPPRRPDWLVILIVILLLLTVLIAFLIGLPNF